MFEIETADLKSYLSFKHFVGFLSNFFPKISKLLFFIYERFRLLRLLAEARGSVVD
jgi:hypothetical protein